MFNPMQKTRRFTLTHLTLLMLWLGACPTWAAPVVDTQEQLIRDMQAHRFEEAANKQRIARIFQAGDRDHTRNMDDYDVRYYDLDMNVNTTNHTFSGTLGAVVEVTAASIDIVEFNLRSSMVVSAATSGGVATTWSQTSTVLTIQLDRSYTAGEQVELSVTYAGSPGGGTVTWSSHGGEIAIWTLSEPYGARDWWPCKDDNSDKPDSMDIRVTVPEHLIVGSNGSLVSNVTNGITRTFHWHSQYPITTYLVSLAIHPYTVYSDWYTPVFGGDDMEVVFYVYPDQYDDVQENYALTVPMIEHFSLGYGEYPFVEEKYGHASFGWGGGMEHQTLTSMGGWSEDLISHELSHQWWGDMITCASFHHIWLNEGFATWSEAYWAEERYGFASYQQYMDYAAYYGPGTIYVENPEYENIFDHNLSYNKASWIPHMLRGMMGNEVFLDALAAYRAAYEYGSATTAQFQAAMEGVSGLDLEAFFQQWIYGEYYPHYRFEWSQDGGTLSLQIEQIQTATGLFTMPIQIRVTTSTGTYEHVVQSSLALETYEITVTGDVESVLLDPEKWILRRVESTVTNPTFDQGILLVNGVDWNIYDSEITSAYEARAFWGDNVISFWDNFSEPEGGYPSTLPTPVGFGAVPADLLGGYSTVIWVGNNYNGDWADWIETPIESYLDVGGNVLLMTRLASSFVDDGLTDYLDISWAEAGDPLGNCVSAYPGIIDVPFIGSQSYNDVFQTALGPDATLLTKDTIGFSGERGTGVHAQPPGGGSERPMGGNFILLSGRPYRMNHDALRANVELILDELCDEPWTVVAVDGQGDEVLPAGLRLSANYPNPFNPTTHIPFALPRAGEAELAIFDVAGRLVKVLVKGRLEAGEHSVVWHGGDEQGHEASSGVYFARLMTAEETLLQRMVLLR